MHDIMIITTVIERFHCGSGVARGEASHLGWSAPGRRSSGH